MSDIIRHFQNAFQVDALVAKELWDITDLIADGYGDLPDDYYPELVTDTQQHHQNLENYQLKDTLARLLSPSPKTPSLLRDFWRQYLNLHGSITKLQDAMLLHGVEYDLDRLITKAFQLHVEYGEGFPNPEQIPIGRNLYETLSPYRHLAEDFQL